MEKQNKIYKEEKKSSKAEIAYLGIQRLEDLSPEQVASCRERFQK